MNKKSKELLRQYRAVARAALKERRAARNAARKRT